MTVEEIKSQYSMRDILSRYGLQANHSGFIRCPFHSGDNTASLKIYQKDFNCYGCGANGDIFKFVQLMENCDFKTAFMSLGGTYESKPSFSTRAAIYKAQKAREQAKKAEKRLADKKAENSALITEYRHKMANSEPLTDEWCDSYNKLQYQLYVHGELNGIPPY